jgi:hypothetical protein
VFFVFCLIGLLELVADDRQYDENNNDTAAKEHAPSAGAGMHVFFLFPLFHFS